CRFFGTFSTLSFPYCAGTVRPVGDRARGARRCQKPRWRITALAAAGCGVLLAAGAASAASPGYCALYAREYAASKISAPIAGDAVGALQRVQDQSYYRCLNQDVEPAFPETSAYFGADVDEIFGGGIGGPFAQIEEG